MFHKFLLTTGLLLFCCALKAQEKESVLSGGGSEGSNLNVLYRNDLTAKIYANTRGLGLLVRRGKHVTAKSRSFYEVDIQSLKHPKEVKVAGTAESRKRYVYGKLNSVMLVRGSVGMQNVIFAKADNKAIEVRFSYAAGPTFAFAKPYYYQLPSNFVKQEVPREVRFNNESFTQDSVVGKGRFSNGLAETAIYPGINGKFNLSFEYASYTNLIRAIETGITVDYFPRALPIMARNPAEYIVITLHVGFVFGKKWY
jgi:hypothetical protein